MAAQINIPIDAHLVTLATEQYRVVQRSVQVGSQTQTRRERVREEQEVAPAVNEQQLRQAVAASNTIFGPADIGFNLRVCSARRTSAPGNRPAVNVQGFMALAREFPARFGVSLLIVSEFQGAELGGQAAEELGVCILRSLSNPMLGKVLAHELGHLLNLGHVAAGAVRNRYNLMWPGLRAGDELTEDQIRTARTSRMARTRSRSSGASR